MTDLCGAINCQKPTDVTVWKVPLCKDHWQECCAKDNGNSIVWLRRNVRNDYKSLFDQYSMKTDKLFLYATKLMNSATEILNKARHMASYPNENVDAHEPKILEAITKVEKLQKWAHETSGKIMELMREIDAELNAAFHRQAKQQEALRAHEADAPDFQARGKAVQREPRERKAKKPSFSLKEMLAKKNT